MPKERATKARVLSSISWYASRGWTSADIASRLKERYSFLTEKNLNSWLDYSMSTRRAASGINRSGSERIVDPSTLPTNVNNPNFVRANVKFTFKAPYKKERLSMMIPFDIQGGLTKEQFYDRIMTLIIDDMLAKYPNRTRNDVERRIQDIQLFSVEGI